MQNTQTSQQLKELAASTDAGARQPQGLSGQLISAVALTWALFQLWYASPLPFTFNIGIFNDSQARVIHLSFAVFLAFTAFPALKRSPRNRVPIQDWVLGLLGASCAMYLYLFYEQLATRPGAPTTLDVTAAVVGMLLLLEATRRALGPPLMIVAGVFLFYIFAGPMMPEVISHRGASLSKAASHLWITSEASSASPLVYQRVSYSYLFCLALCSKKQVLVTTLSRLHLLF